MVFDGWIPKVLFVSGLFVAIHAGCEAADYVVEETEADKAQNVRAGEVRVKATLQSIGIEWFLTGDSDGDATCTVQYREVGQDAFLNALPLFRVRKHNQVTVGEEYPWRKWPKNFKNYAMAGWARNVLVGSVFDLTSGVEYEIQLSLSDPDGGSTEKTVTVQTRPVPTLEASGSVVEITPQDIDQLEQVVLNASAGTVINLHRGVYKAGLIVNAGGTADNPVIIKAAGDGEVIIQGLGPAVRDSQFANHGMVLRGSHLRIDGITFKECFYGVVGYGNDISLTRCQFIGGRTGILIKGNDWYVADNTLRGSQEPASERFGPEGIEAEGEGHVICYNDISYHGDQISLECRDSDVYGNNIHTGSDDGIETDMGGPNLRIFENRIYSIMHNAISFQPYLHGPCYLIRNQISGFNENIFKDRYDSAGLILLHNTLVNFTTISLIRHIYARNNLFVLVPDDKPHKVNKAGRTKRRSDGYVLHYRPVDDVNWAMDLDYNGYVGKIGVGPWLANDHTFDSVDELATMLNNEVHGINTTLADCFADSVRVPQPPDLFESPPMFHLRPGSPVVDGGQRLPNINGDHVGNFPDMGALELGGFKPHYGPRLK